MMPTGTDNKLPLNDDIRIVRRVCDRVGINQPVVQMNHMEVRLNVSGVTADNAPELEALLRQIVERFSKGA